MEEDWLTQLLEEQGAPGALKVDETNPQADPVREPKRAVGVGGNSYITPPTLRKTEAVPANAAALAAGRVPVIAVKVPEEVPEEVDSTEGQSVSSRQSVSPSSEVLAWDSSTSCVPPGAAWVTMVQPPRREKRARKPTLPLRESADGYTSSGEAPHPVRPRIQRRGSDSSVSSSVSNSPRVTHSPRAGGGRNGQSKEEGMKDGVGAGAGASRDVAFSRLPVPDGCRLPSSMANSMANSMTSSLASSMPSNLPMPDERLMRAADGVHNLMAPESFGELVISRDGTSHVHGVGGGLPADADANDDGDGEGGDLTKRKVKHNLTERRRVDRMNQLFNKLYTTIEDTAPPRITDTADGGERLSVCGADGKLINPNKWSKADVLEGALNIIQDLRKQLIEERLARTLTVPRSSPL